MGVIGKVLLCVLLGVFVFSPVSSGDGAGRIGQSMDSGDPLLYGKDLKAAGEFKQAIGFFEQGLALARKLGIREQQLACLMYLGVLNWNIGQIKKSDILYRQGLALAKELGLEHE